METQKNNESSQFLFVTHALHPLLFLYLSHGPFRVYRAHNNNYYLYTHPLSLSLLLCLFFTAFASFMSQPFVLIALPFHSSHTRLPSHSRHCRGHYTLFHLTETDGNNISSTNSFSMIIVLLLFSIQYELENKSQKIIFRRLLLNISSLMVCLIFENKVKVRSFLFCLIKEKEQLSFSPDN